MECEYNKVCRIENFEFGFYVSPDNGCVDEHKVVARFWDNKNNFLDEIILSYEDSPGEAVETISKYLKKGVVFYNVYGTQTFNGGMELAYRDGQNVPFQL